MVKITTLKNEVPIPIPIRGRALQPRNNEVKM